MCNFKTLYVTNTRPMKIDYEMHTLIFHRFILSIIPIVESRASEEMFPKFHPLEPL